MLLYPHAKINIGLNVVARRADGYHDLLTVFYPIELCDVLEVKELRGSNEPYLFSQAGIKLPGAPADNLIIKVYESLREEFSLPPLDVYLYKRVPTQAGLGGGSSDAAHMMRALVEMFHLPLDEAAMERRVARLGADCAFFIRKQPAYATGIGDQLSPVELSLKGWTFVLVKPPVAVSTREAYAGVRPALPAYDLRQAIGTSVEEWRDVVVNDFEQSVFAAHPEIAAIKATLYDMGAVYASMSGSGSAVYGLFRTPQPEAKDIFPDCFTFQQTLRI